MRKQRKFPFIRLSLLGILTIFCFYKHQNYDMAIIFGILFFMVLVIQFLFMRTLYFLDFKELTDLPLIIKTYKDKTYDLLQKENVQDIYKRWFYIIASMRHDFVHIPYCQLLANFFIHGINKLQICYDLQKLLLQINHFYKFINQEVYDYYLKNQLNEYLLQSYIKTIQPFLTEKEIIKYAAEGYEIAFDLIPDEKNKKQAEFLYEIFRK